MHVHKLELEHIGCTASTSEGEIKELSPFVRSMFIAQGKVIVSLKEGQNALDGKIGILANDFGSQLSGLTNLTSDLKQEIICMAHVSA